jgi:hypothetical protein
VDRPDSHRQDRGGPRTSPPGPAGSPYGSPPATGIGSPSTGSASRARRSPLNGVARGARNAVTPINATLNYGYASAEVECCLRRRLPRPRPRRPTRRPQSSYRRMSHLHLTSRGVELFHEAERRTQRVAEVLFAVLSDEERTLLEKMLNRVVTAELPDIATFDRPDL